MKYNKTIQATWDEEDRVLKAMCDLLPVGIEQHGVSVDSFAQTFDTTPSKMGAMKLRWEELGILGTKVTWRQTEPGKSAGKEGHWTLLVGYAEARKLLDAWREEYRRQAANFKPRPRRTAAQMSAARGQNGHAAPAPQTQLVASVGPEADSPLSHLLRLARKDESYAQVEAARQYAARKEALMAKLDELKAAGVTLKVDAMEAFDFEKDDVFEAILTVLPFLNRIEADVERLIAWANEQRPKMRSLEERNRGLERTLDRMQRQQQPTVAHAESVRLGHDG